MSCLFCNIVEKKVPADVVYEDDHCLAFRDIRPVAPTHVLVIPKKHVAAIHDVEAAHVEPLGNLLLAARKVAEKEGLVKDGFRLVVNDGDAAGQTVHHIHVHVLGGKSMGWPPFPQ
jgi:histidine triad (HIT) family protein